MAELKVIRYFAAEGNSPAGWYFTQDGNISMRDSTVLTDGPQLDGAHRIIIDASTPTDFLRASLGGGGGDDEFLISPDINPASTGDNKINIIDPDGNNTVIIGKPIKTTDGSVTTTVSLAIKSVEIYAGFGFDEKYGLITLTRTTTKSDSTADATEDVEIQVSGITPFEGIGHTRFAYEDENEVLHGRKLLLEELKAYLEGTPTFLEDSYTGTIAENSAGGVITLNEALSADDVDTDNTTLTYALVNAPPAFSIDSGTGVISTTAALNFEASATHEFEVRVTDNTNKSSTTTVIITVTNQDEGTASFELRSTGDVAAPAVGDTLSVARTAADPDGNGPLDPLYTWYRFDGTTETSITDSVSGNPVTGSSYTLTDADETFTIRVRATYRDGGGNDENVPVDTAATVAEAPELVLPTLKYLTNATAPVASAADGWYLVTGDASTGYTIDPNNTTAIAPNSADAHRFILDGTTPTGALDGGAGDDEYYIAPTVSGDTTTTIRVTDTQGNNKVIIGDTITTVNGDITTAVSFVLTGVTTTTEDVGGTTVTNNQLEFAVTTTVTDANSDPANVTTTPSTVHVVVREGAEFVFESGDFSGRTFTFADLDAYLGTSDQGKDGAPTFTQDAYTAEVVEGVVPSAAIATVKAIDKDNDTITYSLDQASLGLGFAIDGSSGAITLTSALDHSAVQSATLTVTATAKGKTDTATVTVTVAQNLIPRITTTGNDLTHTLTEGTDYTNEAIATIAATDNDVGDTIAGYDLDADAKALGFAIDANGVLTFTGNLNYEAIPASDGGVITIAVTAIDSKGGTSSPVNVAVTVTNVEEGPTTFTLGISAGGDIANPRVGDTLTVTPDVDDPDGVTNLPGGDYEYTWWRSDDDAGTNRVQITEPGTNNPVTTASYTLGTDDEGKFVEAVVADYRDDGGFLNTPDSSGLTTAKAVQEEANAAPTITTTDLTATIPEGDYSVGQGLEFFTLEVDDTDSGDTLTYDLDQASKDAGFSIAKNAEGNGIISYGRFVDFESLTDDQKTVKLTATVTDGKIATPLTAEITVTFEDVNEQTIFNLSGDTITPAVGDTLEITTSQDDPEGITTLTTAGGYGYTWWRVDENGAETQIEDDATPPNPIKTASYTITQDDLGFVIRAKVDDYTDDLNNNNVITDPLETSRAVITPLADGLTVPSAAVEVAHDSSGLIVLANYVAADNAIPVKIILTYTASDGTSASYTIGETNATPPEHWAKFEPNYNAATDEILLDFSSNAEFVADVGALTPTGIEQTFTITVSQGDSRSFTDNVTLKLTGPDDVPDTTTPFVDSTGAEIASVVSVTEVDLESGTETGTETGTMFINDVDVGDTYELKVGYIFTNGADTTTVAGTDRITIAEGETQTLDTTMGALAVTLNGKEITWTYTYDQNAGALASTGTPYEEFAFEVIDATNPDDASVVATASGTPLRFELVAATETPAFFDSTGMALTTLTGDANIARASGDVVATVLVEFSADDPATMLSETITLGGDDAALFNAAIAQEAGTTDSKVVTIGEKTYYEIEITWAGDNRTETAPSGGNTDDHFDFTITVTNSETTPASATLTARLARVDVALTNEAPVITSTGPFSFDEGDHSSGVVVTTLTYTDAESDVPVFRFVDTDNANALETSITIGGATFTITDGGEITVTGNFDADDETQPEIYTLTVRATDSANNNASDDVEITVNVQNIDEGNAHYSITQNGAILTATLDVADPDGVKDGTIGYQWYTTTDGTSKDAITGISVTNAEQLDTSGHTLPDGARYGVTVTYTDNANENESVEAVQSSVSFEAVPDITPFVDNADAVQSTVPVVTVKANGTGTITYRFDSANSVGSGVFEIHPSDGTIFISENHPAKWDYETTPEYKLVIIATDGATGDIATTTVTIPVTDMPAFTLSSVNDVNAPEVGDVLSVAQTDADPDGNGDVTYTWYRVSNDGNDTQTAILDENDVAVTGTTYTLTADDVGSLVRVRATYTDGANNPEDVPLTTGGAVSAALITFSFVDGANNAVTDSVDVPEDQNTDTFLTISGAVTNAAAGHTLTYSFAPDGNPDDTFAIDGTTGAISIASGKGLDYEVAPNSYTLTIRATYDVDGDAATTDDQETRDVEVTINVTDVDDTATFEFTSTNGGDINAPAVGDKFVISQVGDDPDGHPAAPAGDITYKWFYVDADGVETPIVDGLGDQIDGNPYTIQTADVGKTIRARAEYMDGAGNMDSVPMDIAAPVAAAPILRLADDVIEIAHDTDDGEVLLATVNGNERFGAQIQFTYTASDGTEATFTFANGSTTSNSNLPEYWEDFTPSYTSNDGQIVLDFDNFGASLPFEGFDGPPAPTPGGVEQEFTIDVIVSGSSVAQKTVTIRLTGPEDNPDVTEPFVDNAGTAIVASTVSITETDLEGGTESGVRTGTMFINDVDEGETYGLTVSYAYSLDSDTTKTGTGSVTLTEIMVDPTNANHEIKEDPDNTGSYIVVDRTTGATVMDQAGQPVVPDLTTARHVQGATLDTRMGKLVLTLDGKQIDWTYTYNQDAGALADSGTSTEALTFTLTDAGATDPNPVTPLTFALVAAPEAAEFLELTGTPATITENMDHSATADNLAIIAAADYTVTGATGAVTYSFVQSDGTEIGASDQGFTIAADGAITYTGTANYEALTGGVFTLYVQATDSARPPNTGQVTVSVSVVNVDEGAATVTLAVENDADANVLEVGERLLASIDYSTDPDVVDATQASPNYTWWRVDSGGAETQIFDTQSVAVTTAFYDVTADDVNHKIFARVTYNESLTQTDTADSAQTIAVATANAAPTITVSGTVAIDQGNYIGSQELEIMGLTIDAQDSDSDELTYTLIGTGSDLFRIDNSGKIYAIGDIAHTDAASYAFQVQVDDGVNAAVTSTGSITININDNDREPELVGDLTGAVADQNIPIVDGINTTGTITGIEDPDAGDTDPTGGTITIKDADGSNVIGSFKTGTYGHLFFMPDSSGGGGGGFNPFPGANPTPSSDLGTWTYELYQDLPATRALKDGEVAQDIFTLVYTTSDGTTTYETDVVISVTGADISFSFVQRADGYTFNVDENSKGDIGTVEANDPDADTPPSVTYEFTLATLASMPKYNDGNGNMLDLFTIDSTSGVITLNDELDYEAAGQVKEYELNVLARNLDDNTSASTLVTVRLEDVKEGPTFTEASYAAVNVAEDAAANKEIITLYATDEDTNYANLRFAILSGNDKIRTEPLGSGEIDIYPFHIFPDVDSANDRASVTIRVSVAELDHETKDSYTLTLGVTDGSMDENGDLIYTTTDITINVTDADEDPEFVGTLTGTVVDNATDITATGDVTVVDPDVGQDAPTGGTVSIKDADSASPTTLEGMYGTLTFAPDTTQGAAAGAGTWTYTLDRTDPDTKAIAAGDVETDTFTLVYTEGSNSYETDITISVEGDNNPVEFTESRYTRDVLEGVTLGVIDGGVAVSATDPEGGVVEYSITGGNVQVDDGSGGLIDLFSIDPSNGDVSINRHVDVDVANPVKEYNLEITGSVVGSTDGAGTAQVVVRIFDQNDEDPSIALVGGASVNLREDQAGVDTGISVEITDADADPTNIFKGFVNARGDTTADTAAKFELVEDTTVAGGRTFVLKLANNVQLDYAGDATDTIELNIHVNDGQGAGAGDSNILPVTVTVTETPQTDMPPTITVSGTGSVVEGDYTTGEPSAVITGFTINAQDADNDALTFSLTGTGHELFTINGNKEITAIGALDFEGTQSYALNVVVTANGKSVTSADAITITVTGKDDEDPRFSTFERAPEIVEDAAKDALIVTLSANDVDTNTGDLRFAIISGNPTASGTNHLFAIDDVSGAITLNEAGVLDFEGGPKSYTLNVGVTDGRMDGGNLIYTTTDIVITVTDADEDPEFVGTLTGAVADDVTDITATGDVTVVDPDDGQTAPTGGTVSIKDADSASPTTLEGMYGTLTFAPDTTQGAAAGAGTWTYTLNRDDPDTKAIAAGAVETDTFTLVYTEGSNVYETDITISVEGANNPVAFTETAYTFSVNEGATAIDSVSASDPDTSGDVTYSITSATYNDGTSDVDASALFMIDPTNGAITLTSALDYETADATTYTLIVTAGISGSTDNDNTVEVTVNLVDLNDTAPTFAKTTYTLDVNEDAASGDKVGTPEVAPSGATQGTVTISDDGLTWSYVLTTAPTAGNNVTDSFVLTTTLDDGTTTEETVNVEFIEVSNNPNPVYEYKINGGDATQLGTDHTVAIIGDTGLSSASAIVADDPDTVGALTYSLSGTGHELFEVDANGQISVVGALDFETTPTYTLTLTASDGENTPDATTTVTINVLDVDETPDTDASFAIVSVGGHTDPRADEELRVEIGVEDPNGGVDTNTISYAWYADGDEVNVLSSVATFTPTAAGNYFARVTYTDGNANPEATVNTPAITVAAANQAPTITDPLAASIDAGDYTSATGTVSVDYGVSDAEGDTLSYAFFVNSALTQDNQGFTINSDSGAITFTGSALAHGDNDVILVVQVSDDRGGTAQSTVTVSVASVSAPPVFGANAVAWETGYENGAVDEDVAIGTALATITATDPEDDALTYRVKVGSGDALFEMVGDKLQIKAALDFETAQTHAVIVEVSDDGGASYDAETTVTITVGDVDEAPTFAQDTFTFDVVKGDDLRGFMQTIMATDPEGVTDLTYALVGNGADGFSIDDETGEITVNRDILARDEDRVYRFSVEATDATDNTGSTDITVNVKSGPSVITITGVDNNSDKNDLVDILADWTLTAHVGTDADGVDDSQPKTFFWYHVGDDPSVIPTTAITGSGNQATYVTTDADVGETIAVRYTYTDGDGNVQNVYADVGMPVRTEFTVTNPDEDNDIDLTSETAPQRVDAGDGDDTIKDGQGDDVIIGGAGDDTIELNPNDDQDTVVYGIGGQTAQDGGDGVANFKRGQDKFIFSLKSDLDGVSAIQDMDGFLNFITKGTDDLSDDEFWVLFSIETPANPATQKAEVDGIYLHFNDSVFYSGGRVSMPIVKIQFSENLDTREKIEEIFDGDIAANVKRGILTNLDYLNDVLGGDDEFDAIGYQIIDIA